VYHIVIQWNTKGGFNMSVLISVRLPEELAKELSNVASAIERPKSFLIQKAIESYLHDQADLQIGLDRLRNTTDPVISIEEMKKEIGL
jgi:RHH-type rel operon transcriptional repressor/antitoxin RelB